jgi:hypothetical protein
MVLKRRLDDPESYDPATEPPDPFARASAPITNASPRPWQGPPARGATGEATNAPPADLRSTLASLLGMAYGDGRAGQAFGNQAAEVGGFLPVAGSISSGQQAGDDFKRGDYVGGGINLLGALPDIGPAAKAMFLGLASKTADRGALKTAQELLAGGATPEEALKKTGWFQQHGDWKYEIPDDAAMIGNAASRDLDATGKSDRSLSGTLWHDDLYKAHPDMRSIPTTAAVGPDVKAAGRHGGATEAIQFAGPDEEAATKVGLHEAQHAVQLREGFPRGGSSSEYARGMMFDPKARDLQGSLSKELTGSLTYPVPDLLSDIKYLDPAKVDGIAKQFGFASPDEALDFLKKEDFKRTPVGQYHRTAGEVEARNTARRQGLSEQQRRDIPPWATQDVPDDQQIVRRYDEDQRGQLATAMSEPDRLKGAPDNVEGPVPHVVEAAQTYAQGRGIPLDRQRSYAEVNPRRAGYIAKAYDAMPHDPGNPKVAASYKALADETMAQWQALQDSGAKIEFMKPGQADPYPGGPRDALADIRANNHLFVFPSEQGFGSGAAAAIDNPMLASTGQKQGDHNILVNDAFRAVHDYFGHGMEGAHFGPRGEENAWQAHKALFSPEALPALTTETRGQNSWVNFGPHGEANRANPRDTIFADQKAGLLPAWATREGGMPMAYRAQQAGTVAALLSALGLAGSSQKKE